MTAFPGSFRLFPAYSGLFRLIPAHPDSEYISNSVRNTLIAAFNTNTLALNVSFGLVSARCLEIGR